MSLEQLFLWGLIVWFLISMHKESKSKVEKGDGDKLSSVPTYGELTTHKEDMNWSLFFIVIFIGGAFLMFLNN